jgi:hypothetical protein
MIAAQTLLLDPAIIPREALYGCNMALRMAHGHAALGRGAPAGWQEDIDFTMRLSRRGRLISTGLVSGVHLGVKGAHLGPAPGLFASGQYHLSAAQGHHARRRSGASCCGAMSGQPDARAVSRTPRRSARPAAGNALAFLDLWRGRIDPRKIESM